MDPARLKQVGDRLDVAFHDAVARESERPEHKDDEGAWALTAGVLSAAQTIWVSQYADLLDHHARRAGRQLPEDELDAAAQRIAQAVSDAGVAAFEREGRRFGLQVLSPAKPTKKITQREDGRFALTDGDAVIDTFATEAEAQAARAGYEARQRDDLLVDRMKTLLADAERAFPGLDLDAWFFLMQQALRDAFDAAEGRA
ncbi:MAG: hypothetical protein L0191_02090 [Acidobacteria bacterium]|nr:hypothetical protein [Acidobacteriota bacterium]